ncbi:MAG: hypothetical protein L3J59_07220 [Methylococcaceae bacterium]|nr:hypothetical protein [Methylococcaceae bacterium]
MKKINKEYKPLDIEDVRSIRGHMFGRLRRSKNKIPDKAGVYIWRYWPNMNSHSADDILELINKLQNNFPSQEENLSNSRLTVTVERTPFGKKYGNKFLGIDNKNKVDSFKRIIKKNEEARLSLIHTLEVLVASSPPIYIGKANNLRKRLSEHFDSETNLLSNIYNAGISLDDIYISYIIDDISSDVDAVTTTIEEILQRLTNPPYTKRYG